MNLRLNTFHDVLKKIHLNNISIIPMKLIKMFKFYCFSYPFYGLQFHPEKVLYEWVPNKGIAHSSAAKKVSQYFGLFLIEQCANNTNRYFKFSISNFPTTYTGRQGLLFEQCYLFKKEVRYPV